MLPRPLVLTCLFILSSVLLHEFVESSSTTTDSSLTTSDDDLTTETTTIASTTAANSDATSTTAANSDATTDDSTVGDTTTMDSTSSNDVTSTQGNTLVAEDTGNSNDNGGHTYHANIFLLSLILLISRLLMEFQ